VRECAADGPFNVFEPELIRHALENEKINLGSLIFGPELWMVLHTNAGLSPACLSSNNALATFYSHVSSVSSMVFMFMMQTRLILFRTSSARDGSVMAESFCIQRFVLQ
jgi:hypothetical protein